MLEGHYVFCLFDFFSTCIFLSTSPLQPPQVFISPSPCNNMGYSSHWYYLLFIFTKVTFRRGKKDSFLAAKDDDIYREDFTFLPILDLIFSFFFIEPCEIENVVCFKLNSTTKFMITYYMSWTAVRIHDNMNSQKMPRQVSVRSLLFVFKKKSTSIKGLFSTVKTSTRSIPKRRIEW